MSSSKNNVFIVDDDVMYTMLIQDFIESKGDYNISAFSTGEECLQNLNSDVDVIILDYNLDADVPGAMNGQEVYTEIRKVNSEVMILMISAQDSYFNKNEGNTDSKSSYIVKNNDAFSNILKFIQE